MVTQREQTIADAKTNWQPKWLVDIGNGCQCGVTIDDHCYVVLSQDWDGNWQSSKHIPLIVAKFLGKLATEQLTVTGGLASSD